jgi:hypothetical protein
VINIRAHTVFDDAVRRYRGVDRAATTGTVEAAHQNLKPGHVKLGNVGKVKLTAA